MCEDFTKQYNRLRQQRDVLTNANAVAGPSRPSALTTKRPLQGRKPLPAQNPHRALAAASTSSNGNSRNRTIVNPALLKGGAVSNPKAENDRSTKDKSDRATHEQVLDGRTRLVLAGLLNRDIIGPLDRCISTGKEVCPPSPL